MHSPYGSPRPFRPSIEMNAFHKLNINSTTTASDEVDEHVLQREGPSPLRRTILSDVQATVKSHSSYKKATDHSLSRSKMRWSRMYENKKNKSFMEREKAREDENRTRRNYKPRTVDYTWLDGFSNDKYLIKPIRYNALQGPRHSNCLICWMGVSPGEGRCHYSCCCSCCCLPMKGRSSS